MHYKHIFDVQYGLNTLSISISHFALKMYYYHIMEKHFFVPLSFCSFRILRLSLHKQSILSSKIFEKKNLS